MKKSIFIALFSVVFSTFLFAENQDTVAENPTAQITPQVNLRPQLRATLRVRGEHDLNENVNRFNVPNARVVLFGNATEWLSYQMQVDLNNHGQFRFLDMEARFREGRDFSFRAGQMLVPFSQIQQLVPRMVALTDLPWIVTQGRSGAFRDIGVNATYRFRVNGFPIFFTGGIYNGAGIGNPTIDWTNNMAHSFRLMAGTADNIRFSIKTYHNELHELYGVDFRFFRNGFTIDAEFLRGNYVRTFAGEYYSTTEISRQVGSLLHVGKMFQTGRNTVRYLEPIVRWDMLGMANNFDISDANRLTFGLNLGFREFNQSQFFRTGELRLNYGHTFVNAERAHLYFGDQDIASNRRAWANMITVEFLFEI